MLKLQTRCLQRLAAAHTQAASWTHRRHLVTLAIETSCDDTSLAVLQKRCSSRLLSAQTFTFPSLCHLHFHKKITANNSAHAGIHPVVALESHQENLAILIQEALEALPHASSHSDDQRERSKVGGAPDILPRHNEIQQRIKPDFISVTRGPGMRSSLTTGLDTAKGLAVAWQIPLVGVNHMQAHALTPRLVSALNTLSPESEPAFPFLSLLVSGGHTLLVHSKELCEHAILASTTDIAIGDAIDKMARSILPPIVLNEGGEIMYGRLLERFAFPNGERDHNYTAPSTRTEENARKESKWGWSLAPPLAETRSGSKSRAMEFTFSGLGSAVKRICEANPAMGQEQRQHLARESMRIAFEHLASRVGWALTDLHSQDQKLGTLVVSGGVASNKFLRTVLRDFLCTRGFPHLKLSFPPIELCTDNAAMIAWTGMEMFERGWESDLKCRALRKWSVDPSAEDGGVLGVDCWKRIVSRE